MKQIPVAEILAKSEFPFPTIFKAIQKMVSNGQAEFILVNGLPAIRQAEANSPDPIQA